MLRIIHTGRAYEVLDLESMAYYCEIKILQALLRNAERKLRATELELKLELKPCQKSTLDT